MSRNLLRPWAGIPALLSLCFLACAAPAPGPPPPGPIHLVVLHTNDVHGQVLPRRATWLDREDPPEVGGLVRLAAAIARERAGIDGPDEGVLVLDAGDWYQGTPEGRLDLGAGFVAALVAVGYDAMAIGNHELDHGLDNLLGILDGAKPPSVAANLRDPATGERVPWVVPYRIFERAGLRIAVVGLLTPVTPQITHPDAATIRFQDPAPALREAIAELEGRADIVLALTHLGLEDDLALADALPDLPLIVGGHSHTYLDEGARQGDALIVQAGTKATVLGRVDLWIERGSGRVLESSARLIDLEDDPGGGPRNPEVEGLCDDLVRRAAASMEEIVGELSSPLTRGRGLRSSPAGNLIADTFRDRTGAAAAIHNRGGIRSELAAGPVSRRDLFELLPFDNTLVVLELSGAELFECVRRAVEGTEHGGIELSGMRVHVRLRSGGTGELVGIEVGGRPLALEATYRVATNSFLARGGDGYFDGLGGDDSLDTGLLLREILEDVLREGSPVTPPGEDRYAVEEES